MSLDDFKQQVLNWIESNPGAATAALSALIEDGGFSLAQRFAEAARNFGSGCPQLADD